METVEMVDVSLILRKKLPQNNSIEGIFLILKDFFDTSLNVKAIELKSSGAMVNSILSNMQFTRKISCKIIHITGDVHYAGLFSSKPVILTIHDIGSTLRGNFFKQFFLKLIWYWLPAVKAKRITVISEFSKKELCKLIPFAKSKISVIHNPVNPALDRNVKQFNFNKPIVLHLGTKQNKNLERTIEALAGLDYRMVIIGKLQPNQLKLLKETAIDYNNEYNITFDRVKELYESCDIVSFVSLYEGFGMPIIEAQKIGRPVITSSISSMPEVGGKGACYVDPFSIESIRSAFLKIVHDSNYRNMLIVEGLENVKRFEIENIANQYSTIYKEVISGT